LKHARITELAGSDLAKIWLYIARDNQDVAVSSSTSSASNANPLASVPQQGRPRPEFAVDLRSYRVGNCFIFYFPTDNGIEAARVLHGARDLPRVF